MKANDYLAIIGISINIIGTFLLAISLNKIIKTYDFSITALEHFKDTLLSGGDIASFQELDKHRKNALTNNKKFTQLGLILILIGFVCQLFSILINITK